MVVLPSPERRTPSALHSAEGRKADVLVQDFDLGEADLGGADLSGATLSLEEAKNITPEQLAQIKLLVPTTPQKAKTEQTSTMPAQSEIKPDQTSKEAEQIEHEQPKQDADTS